MLTITHCGAHDTHCDAHDMRGQCAQDVSRPLKDLRMPIRVRGSSTSVVTHVDMASI